MIFHDLQQKNQSFFHDFQVPFSFSMIFKVFPYFSRIWPPWSLFPFSILQAQRGCSFLWQRFLLYSCRLRWSSWSTTLRDIPWNDICKQDTLLLTLNFVIASRLELICKYLILNTRSSLIHFHSSQLVLILP